MLQACSGRRLLAGALVVLAVVLVLMSVDSRSAFAHGGDESDRASELVLQAIALIVNEPDEPEMVAEKIADALEASKTKGVDLTRVRDAKRALAAGRVHRARTDLERAIGARPHRGEAEPAPIREVGPPPKGAAPGRAVPSDPLPGRTALSLADWLVLVVAAVLIAVGAVLSFHYRPQPASSRS